MAVALGALWLLVCWQLIAGRESLYFRDLFNLFFPLKAFGAQQLAHARIPVTNPTWGLGAPFSGTPNSSAFYPDNLLYLAWPFLRAFNLHFVVHWGLAALTMGLLARRLGQSQIAAVFSGCVYASSGWMLSALTFYNITAIAAWIPLMLLGAVLGGAAGALLGGMACGLAILAGEPITLLFPLALAVVLMLRRHGLWAGPRLVAGTAAVAFLVALPQLVSTARILSSATRWRRGLVESQVGFYRMTPLRLFELWLPFPFGRPGDSGGLGVWHSAALPHAPFYLSLHFGAVALILALVAARKRRCTAALAALGLLVPLLPAGLVPLLRTVSLGLFQSPEKTLILPAIAVPLLAGWGLDAMRRDARLPVVPLLVVLGGAWLVGFSSELFWPQELSSASRTYLWSQVTIATLLAVGCAYAWSRRRPVLIVMLHVLAVLQLHPLLLTDRAPYEARPRGFAAVVPAGSAVVASQLVYPPWTQRLVSRGYAQFQRRQAELLAAAPGILRGNTYPAASDLDGTHNERYSFLMLQLSRADWSARMEWLRRMGAEYLASLEEVPPGDFWRLVAFERGDADSQPAWLYQIQGSLPLASWPARLLVTPSALETFKLLSQAKNRDASVVPIGLRQGSGSVEVISEGPDRIELKTGGEGGLVVVRRAFLPLWKARLHDHSRLQVLPVDVTLLGVVVPPGEQQVALSVDELPEKAALAISWLGIACLAGWWIWRSRQNASAGA